MRLKAAWGIVALASLSLTWPAGESANMRMPIKVPSTHISRIRIAKGVVNDQTTSRSDPTTSTTQVPSATEVPTITLPSPDLVRIAAKRGAVGRMGGSSNRIYTLNSTSYCQAGITASGQRTSIGEVANNTFAFGTKLLILSGEHKGEVVSVEDRIGAYSQLDFFTPNCADALKYGREEIQVEVVK